LIDLSPCLTEKMLVSRVVIRECGNHPRKGKADAVGSLLAQTFLLFAPG
jgi:hypothetical protein